jgi:hypothetical protein
MIDYFRVKKPQQLVAIHIPNLFIVIVEKQSAFAVASDPIVISPPDASRIYSSSSGFSASPEFSAIKYSVNVRNPARSETTGLILFYFSNHSSRSVLIYQARIFFHMPCIWLFQEYPEASGFSLSV